MEKNYYEMLGVPQSASEQDIQTAANEQLRLWGDRLSRHVPMALHAHQMVLAVGKAKETLLDPSKRRAYDASMGTIAVESVVPADKPNWLDTAYEYYDDQNLEMARLAVERATRQQSDNPEAWFLASLVYCLADDYDAANKATQQLLLLSPDDPTAYGLRGEVCMMQPDGCSKAIEMYKEMRALADDPVTREYAEEMITRTTVTQMVESMARDYEQHTPEEGLPHYDEAMMHNLHQLKERLVKAKREVENTIAEVKDPNSEYLSFGSIALEECDKLIGNVQTMIDVGNQTVTSPLFWFFAIFGFIFGVPGLLLMIVNDLAAGIMGFLFLLIAALCALGAYVSRKPLYKVKF